MDEQDDQKQILLQEVREIISDLVTCHNREAAEAARQLPGESIFKVPMEVVFGPGSSDELIEFAESADIVAQDGALLDWNDRSIELRFGVVEDRMDAYPCDARLKIGPYRLPITEAKGAEALFNAITICRDMGVCLDAEAETKIRDAAIIRSVRKPLIVSALRTGRARLTSQLGLLVGAATMIDRMIDRVFE